ncbi:MAG: tetratricopeptide repeat protein [Prevotella sp.]|nr:tetratricopeptide repeat protein [Prevotella sp.]
MKQILTVIILALLTITPVRGEVLAKKIVEPVTDSLTIFIQAGDSCMQQYNTFGALKYFKEAFARCDSSLTRIKLADCYYKRANYRKTSELLKNIPTDSLSHEAFRQLCYSYQKQGDTDSYVYWTGHLVSLYPMDGEMVAGLTLAHAKQEQAFKGIECGKAYFEKDSTNILVNRALADAYFIDRQFDKAVTMYERLLHQGDSTFNTLYSAGMCYTRIDSLNKAYNCLLPAFYLSQMQHSGCAYRLGAVSIDLHSYEEGLRYLDIALQLMQPDTTTMKAITLSQGEGYYLTKQYDKAVESWKHHLEYNPASIATYYNIASAYYYLLPDGKQAKAYLEKFLDLARKEEKPTQQLSEMIEKAETLLCTTNFVGGKSRKR